MHENLTDTDIQEYASLVLWNLMCESTTPTPFCGVLYTWKTCTPLTNISGNIRQCVGAGGIETLLQVFQINPMFYSRNSSASLQRNIFVYCDNCPIQVKGYVSRRTFTYKIVKGLHVVYALLKMIIAFIFQTLGCFLFKFDVELLISGMNCIPTFSSCKSLSDVH